MIKKTKNTSLIKPLFFLVVFIILIGPALVIAQQNYVPLAPIEGITNVGQNVVNVGNYLRNLYRLGIGLAAALAVIVLAYGGIRYMTSEVISSKSAAIGMMRNAVGGLILALSSFILLNTINPDLVSLDLGIRGVNVEVEGIQIPTGQVQAGLIDFLNNLQTEGAEINRQRSLNTSTALKDCYDLYATIVRDQITSLSSFVEIVRKTNPVVLEGERPFSPLETLITSSVAALFPVTSFLDSLKQIKDAWDEEHDLSNRFNQIYNALAGYVEISPKSIYDKTRISSLGEAQRGFLYERYKKALGDMTNVAGALLGGNDATVTYWTNYSFCSSGDTYATALDTPSADGTISLSLDKLNGESSGIQTDIDWLNTPPDECSSQEIEDVGLDPSSCTDLNKGVAPITWSRGNSSVNLCLKAYKEIVMTEIETLMNIAIGLAQGNQNSSQRINYLNNVKDTMRIKMDQGLAKYPVSLNDLTLLSPSQNRRLNDRINQADTELDTIIPTVCTSGPDEPPGCGGGDVVSAGIEPEFQQGLCNRN